MRDQLLLGRQLTACNNCEKNSAFEPKRRPFRIQHYLSPHRALKVASRACMHRVFTLSLTFFKTPSENSFHRHQAPILSANFPQISRLLSENPCCSPLPLLRPRTQPQRRPTTARRSCIMALLQRHCCPPIYPSLRCLRLKRRAVLLLLNLHEIQATAVTFRRSVGSKVPPTR